MECNFLINGHKNKIIVCIVKLISPQNNEVQYNTYVWWCFILVIGDSACRSPKTMPSFAIFSFRLLRIHFCNFFFRCLRLYSSILASRADIVPVHLVHLLGFSRFACGTDTGMSGFLSL